MDKISWIVIAALFGLFIIRFRYAMRKAKMNQHKGEDIQKKLQQLRKKRDED